MNPETPTTNSETTNTVNPPIGNSTNPSISLNQQQPKINIKNPKVFFAIFGLIVLLLIILGISLTSIRNNNDKISNDISQIETKTWNQNSVFPATERVAQVGSEVIYGNDLNHHLETYYTPATANEMKSNPNTKAELLKMIATESAILQAAKDQNITSIPDTIFSVNKDFERRQQLLNEIRETVKNNSDTYSGSVISIWYYNMVSPKIGESQAKQQALNKITSLHQQLINKQITMKQAGDDIKADTSLAQLDTNYVGNAYSIIDNVNKDSGTFTHSKIVSEFYKLKPGEISPVIEIDNQNSGAKLTEKFYSVVQMDSFNKGKYSSLGKWIMEATDKYNLTN